MLCLSMATPCPARSLLKTKDTSRQGAHFESKIGVRTLARMACDGRCRRPELATCWGYQPPEWVKQQLREPGTLLAIPLSAHRQV
jgi:hypothetical protein